MSFIKPIAALSSGLLARKGAARPAMRSPLDHYPSGTGQPFSSPGDDLGWNDMGDDWEPLASAEVAAPEVAAEASEIGAAIVAISASRESSLAAGGDIAKPDVVLQQEALTQRMVKQPVLRLPRGVALSQGRRAAFTLRVDAERHRKLRVACNLFDSSAQMLIIAALDQFLAELPEESDPAAQPDPRS
jgi:hypothetical protein